MNPAIVLLTAEDDDFEIFRVVVDNLRPAPVEVFVPLARPHSEPRKPKRKHVELPTDRNALIERFLPMVTTITLRMKGKLPPQANFDDLYSCGVHGLISAVDNYKPDQSRTFAGYAGIRIRGAILDELRKMDIAPRRARAKRRLIDAAVLAFESKHGRSPNHTELAAAAGMSPKLLQKCLDETRNATFVELDSHAAGEESEGAQLHEFLKDENDVTAAETMQQQETIKLMLDRINELSPIKRRILREYYFDNKRLWEIAEGFGLTESRVCQIRVEALDELRRFVNRGKDR